MTDSMLSLVPKPQAPQRAAQGSARAVVEAKQNDSDQGFKGVLKSRMTPESKANSGAEKARKAQPEAESVAASDAQGPTDAGKPLPPAGTAASELTDEAAAALVLSVEELLVAELVQDGNPLADLEQDPAAESYPGNLLEMLQVPAATENRARPPFNPAVSSATVDLPNTAQVAIAQAVRTAMSDGAPVAAQQLGAQPGAATVLTGAAGLEALTARLLAAGDTSTVAPLQHNSTALPQDAIAATRSALPTASLNVPLRQPGWDQALSERVMWVANQKFQGVELKLNPAHLGPIEIRVQMQNDQAQVSFVAQHGPVREALEAALPRLREMFNANGFNLVDVDISQHSFAEQQRHANHAERRGMGDFSAEDEAEMGGISLTTGVPLGAEQRGGVDLFA